MRVIEFKIEDGRFVAVGDNPDALRVYRYDGEERQLTNMRWPALTRFVDPDDAEDLGEMDAKLIDEVYGRVIAKPSGSRPLADPEQADV